MATSGKNFPRQLRENGVLDHDNAAPPENLKAILEFFRKDRLSPAPGEKSFDNFMDKTLNAPNAKIIDLVVQPLLEESVKPGYHSQRQLPLSRFPRGQGFMTAFLTRTQTTSKAILALQLSL